MSAKEPPIQCRTIRIFPRIRETPGNVFATAYALYLGTEPRSEHAVEWYAQELTLDDEKRPVWRLLATDDSRPGLMGRLRADGHLTPETAVVFDMEGTP
jgi:hypothetical protein